MDARYRFYLDQAALSRDLSERASDPEIAAHLRKVAEQYERLADAMGKDAARPEE